MLKQWWSTVKAEFAAGYRMALADKARVERAQQIIEAHLATGLAGHALDSWMARNAQLRAGRS